MIFRLQHVLSAGSHHSSIYHLLYSPTHKQPEAESLSSRRTRIAGITCTLSSPYFHSPFYTSPLLPRRPRCHSAEKQGRRWGPESKLTAGDSGAFAVTLQALREVYTTQQPASVTGKHFHRRCK